MAQRNVEWYSVYTNGVALCRIALQNIRRSIWTLNSLALHEIFRCCGESLCLLVGFGEIASGHATKNADRKWNSDLLGGMTSSNMKTVAKPSHVVRGLLHLAVKQSQFSEFLLFFSRRYCIYSLSFMKALIKIATRLDSTTVCRPPGLPRFARVGEPECL